MSEQFKLFIAGLAILFLFLTFSMKEENRSCADFSLGISFGDGKCHTFGFHTVIEDLK